MRHFAGAALREPCRETPLPIASTNVRGFRTSVLTTEETSTRVRQKSKCDRARQPGRRQERVNRSKRGRSPWSDAGDRLAQPGSPGRCRSPGATPACRSPRWTSTNTGTGPGTRRLHPTPCTAPTEAERQPCPLSTKMTATATRWLGTSAKPRTRQFHPTPCCRPGQSRATMAAADADRRLNASA